MPRDITVLAVSGGSYKRDCPSATSCDPVNKLVKCGLVLGLNLSTWKPRGAIIGLMLRKSAF